MNPTLIVGIVAAVVIGCLSAGLYFVGERLIAKAEEVGDLKVKVAERDAIIAQKERDSDLSGRLVRLEGRINDPRKTWKLTDMDLKSYTRWFDYGRARDAMLHATSSPWAPWHIAITDDKKRGRLNIITHLLSQIPYEHAPQREVKLPRRQARGKYVEPDHSGLHIPRPY